MTRAVLLAFAIAATASAPGLARAEVPTTVGFTARLVSDDTGDAATGSKHLTFELFAAATGGGAEWTEAKDLTLADGLLVTALGETTPLTADVLDGRALFLQVTVGDVVLSPRIPLASVPYAVRASDTDTIAGVALEALQQRVTGVCASGTSLTAVNADGTVTCAPTQGGSGDITGVSAGAGLEGGGGAGNVTLGLLSTCTVGQVLKWSGTTWACAADVGSTGSTGDITSVTVGPGGGLSGGGTTGDVQLSLLTTCATGQLLKWSGSAWTCAGDLDTGAGAAGDITDVIAGNGLSGGATTGAATLNVVAGSGITVAADSVGLDFAVTDTRYVNATGDGMSGNLDLAQNHLLNRGCPTGYGRAGAGLCVEMVDTGALTFTACANKCRAAGTHLCSSAEMRGYMQSGINVGGTVLYDWIDDQDADSSALYVSNASSAEDPDAAHVTSSTSMAYCRCCADVE